MRSKLLTLEHDLPSFVRFDQEDYPKLATQIRVAGGNPWSKSELATLFDDLSIVRIATSSGKITLRYTNKVVRFYFYKGFAYNTASVPGPLKMFFDNDSFPAMVASMFHDGGYLGQQVSKEDIDRMFVDVIEYYHDKDDDPFSLGQLVEDFAENAIETAIELAFKTDEADRCWNQGIELSAKSGATFRVEIVEV